MPNAVIAHAPDGKFDLDALKREARAWPGLVGMDLVPMVTSGQRFTWDETPWQWGKGHGRQEAPEFHVVAVDYGIKRNILRLLAGTGCRVTVVPAKTSAEDILALEPDGVFLSNGPGDPAATGEYAVPVIRSVIDAGIPTFGICLGHQMLGIAVGAKTVKMHQGHHGANHPVKDLVTGKVEITSMNHGFAVDARRCRQMRPRPMCCCSTARTSALRSKASPGSQFRYTRKDSLARPVVIIWSPGL